MKLSEQWIISQAPNSSAVQNGKKLSQKGSFFYLSKLSDDTLFWADCAGSGKNPYHTSVDFIDETSPVFRCSCPSRQFPCKHAIGLTFEILQEKEFKVAEIPNDLAEKRSKQAAKKAKKEQSLSNNESTEKTSKKTNNAAKAKKIKKQLEGLDKAEQLIIDLLSHGVGTLAGTSAKTYQTLAKDLSSYYLTGVQTAFLRLSNEIEKLNNNNQDYQEIIRILIWLNAMVQKSRAFLNQKLENKNYDVEDNELYEALGGVWKLEELEKIGSFKENAQLIQLSFDVLFDEAKKEYIDRGYWIDVQTGEISQTLNYRPLKALKHIKAEDSCFEAVNIPKLCYYPKSVNKRVRWENCSMQEITNEMLENTISNISSDLSQTIKAVKNEIKNTLSEKYVAVAIKYKSIGKIENETVLCDEKGEKIILRDRKADGEEHFSVDKLNYIPNNDLFKNQIMFGLMFYDSTDSKICMHPYSIISNKQIIRLQY